MTETRVNTKTHCRYCGTELSHDKARKCKICLTCHPPNLNKPVPVKEKKKYIDVAMTESRVREIVRDELENWHIQKPSVTKSETEKIFEDEYNNPSQKPLTETETKIIDTGTKALAEKMAEKEQGILASPNWRQQAKELGIPLFHKKKEDVLKEIEARTSGLTNVPTDGGQ